MDDDELTMQRMADVLVHLAREYANVTNTLCADIRVPKDLRDQLAAHTVEVLNELPMKVHRAVDPTYGLEDAKVDWAGRIVVDEHVPPGLVVLSTEDQIVGYNVPTGKAAEMRRDEHGQWGDIQPLDLDEAR